MPKYEWRVDFESSGTFRTIPDVQSVNIFRGRRLQIDDYKADTLTVSCRNPDGWTYEPKLGERIIAYVNRPGVVTGIDRFPGFIGNIRDVAINYGKVPAEDSVTIYAEGIQADFGRAQLNGLALLQELVEEQMYDIATATGLNLVGGNTRSTASAQTYTGNAMELVNKLVRTEEARIEAVSFDSQVTWPGTWELYFNGRDYDPSTNTPFTFNDGTKASSPLDLKYDNIEFRSSADNYYNSITINPEFVASQTATLGVTPLFSWEKTTLDFSTGQANDHAQWLLNNFQTTDSTVASISFTDVEQVDTPPPLSPENTTPLTIIQGAIGQITTIGFRGQVLNCICEGISVSANTNQTRITLYLSGQDTNAYLILNNAIFGKLDFNKLGY